MNIGIRGASVAVLLVFAYAATAQAAPSAAPVDRPSNVAIANRPVAESSLVVHRVVDPERAEAVVEVRVEAPDAAKRDSLPGTEAFVLLGMFVVLVGVVARPKRGFRRSGTILSR